jgi:hypothetical protein
MSAHAQPPPRPQSPPPIDPRSIPVFAPLTRPECVIWVVWEWTWNASKKKWDKPPRQINGNFAKSDDPATWTTFETVWAAVQCGRFNGVGVMLLGRKSAYVDLDNVRDPGTGALLPWAQQLIALVPDAYVEITPSGCGVRIVGTDDSSLPTHTRKPHPDGGYFELFVNVATGRYITVSAHQLPGRISADTPCDISTIVSALVGLNPRKGKGRGNGSQQPASGGTVIDLSDPRIDKDTAELIEYGTKNGEPSGDRSDDFFWVVRHLRRGGYSLADVLATLEAYPDGVQEKYDGRLEKELRRVWEEKLDGDPIGGGEFKLEDGPPDPPPPGLRKDTRPVIALIAGEAVATAVRLEALIPDTKLPVYYRHGLGQLCYPMHEHRKRHDGRSVTVGVLRAHSVATLRRLISGIAQFIRFDGRSKKWVRCELPSMIIEMILAGRSEQIFPGIKGLISTPILRPDRSIITQPGYDADSGYYMIGAPTLPPIPAAPTRGDALAALAGLADLLSEFPFVDKVSESVAYSGLITPLVRAACAVVPGHLYTAPRQGSGKSLLVDLVSAIATGDAAYAILFYEHLPEELDKQIAAAVIEGRQIITLDNLTGELGSALFGQVLERLNVSVRPFGRLETVAIINAFNGYGTGNNVTITGDLARRLLESRIDPRLENPLDRVFKKPNPLARVQADRGRYIADCLTIVRAYHVANRPAPLTPTPSYGDWSELVREPLVWLGLPDPTDSMRAALAEDPANASLANLIAAWPTVQPEYTAAELVLLASAPGVNGQRYPDLFDAIKAVAGTRQPGGIDASAFGNYLRNNRDKIVGGKKIVRVKLNHHKVAVWAAA